MGRVLAATAVIVMLAASAGPCSAQGRLLVNEVFTGNPDYIEIISTFDAPIDLGGWTVQASFGRSLYPAFAFPAGTTIAPGEAVIVLENATPFPPTATQPPPGTQVFNTGFGYGWVGDSSGMVLLGDAAGLGHDLVVFGTEPVMIPPAGAGLPFHDPIDRSFNNPTFDDALFRSRVTDTDSGADWTNLRQGNESPGQLNPGQSQVGLGIRAVLLDPATARLAFDTAASTVTLQATVRALVTTEDVEVGVPAYDPLIGGTVRLTAAFVGGDLAELEGMIWAGVVVELETVGHDASLELRSVIRAHSPLEHALGGPAGATPIGVRAMTSQTYNTVRASGVLPFSLESLRYRLGSEPYSLLVRLEPGGLLVSALEVDYAPDPVPEFAAAMAPRGPGQIEVGAVNTIGPHLYNVFAINSPIPAGTGPLFGLELGPLQMMMIGAPLGTVPFRVTPAGDGTWSWLSPAGAIPPGVVLDFVSITVDHPAFAASDSVRILL